MDWEDDTATPRAFPPLWKEEELPKDPKPLDVEPNDFPNPPQPSEVVVDAWVATGAAMVATAVTCDTWVAPCVVAEYPVTGTAGTVAAVISVTVGTRSADAVFSE
jgi:predicted phosphoribosyltransferase